MKTSVCADKSAFALVSVLFVIAIISTFMAMLSYSSSQRVAVARRRTDQIKAKAMAEAGCEYGFAILSQNWESRFDPAAFSFVPPGAGLSSLSNVDKADYVLSVTAIGSNAATVHAIGTCGRASAEAIIGVQDLSATSAGGQVFDDEAFNYAILCGGSFDFGGCGTISSPGGNARFHANSAMDLGGNTHPLIDISSSTSIKIKKLTVGGDVTAPFISTHSHTIIEGTETETAVPPVAIPDIDLTPYYNWAHKNGEVKSGGFSIAGSYSPVGGILWVDGDFHASSFAEINGSVIATGSITIAGQVDVNPTVSAFCLVSRNGNIKITSTGTLNGLIYTKSGDFEHTANGEIHGQIIVNGSIKKGGTSDIMAAYTQSIPSLPDEPPPTMLIGVSAWQK